MAVVIETTLGDFTVDLYIDDRPNTCKNFLKLCKMKYYNFCLFHSVQHNFIAQTGDPTGTGKNGESVFGKIYGEEKKFFEAEMMPKMKHTRSGLLSMVNCGNNMLGSQFFLTLGYELQSLDNEHCIFGEVSEGHEILLKLNDVICDTEHRPYQDIRITHTVILEDPFDDPRGLVVPDSSPEPSNETLLNARIAPDEELDETKGRSAAELEEVAREREAKAQATILEIVGDLPDAEIAPPENVLFVCKLNPVTTDDDLEIIFSRFGKVKCCEVIRDKVTGDSLQYAFVEFEEQKACEDAFFKMDNVLIDDRRIHVDFSQSVSKLHWKGKGRGVEHVDGQVNTNIISKRNPIKVQDHKQSTSGYSNKGVKEVGNYRDSSKSGRANEDNIWKAFKQDDKHCNYREDYVLKSDDIRRDNKTMKDRHKAKNESGRSEEGAMACQEYLGFGDRYKNKRGNDGSHINKNARDAKSDSYQEDHRSGSSYRDKKTQDTKSRLERDDICQKKHSSSNRNREESKRGNQTRNERDSSYQEDRSLGYRHRPRDESKRGNQTRSERDSSYQEDHSSGKRYRPRDESKKGNQTRNERDSSYQEDHSLGNRYREKNKKSRNEGDSVNEEEISSGNLHTDKKKRGSKSSNVSDKVSPAKRRKISKKRSSKKRIGKSKKRKQAANKSKREESSSEESDSESSSTSSSSSSSSANEQKRIKSSSKVL